MNILSGQLALVRRALAADRERVASATAFAETAFLPAALEVIERPVSPTARRTAQLLLAGLVVMLLWLMLGHVDVVASAPGRVVPADNVKLIQPLDGGVVSAILVHDGERVRRGQALVVLDPTSTAADVAQARQALNAAQLDAARAGAVLRAMDGGSFAFVAPAGTDPLLAETHRRLAAAQLAQIRAGMSAQGAGSRAAAAEVGEARGESEKLHESIPLLREQLEANEKLLAKGFVSKLRVIEMRRQYLAALRDRDIAARAAGGAGARYAAAVSGAMQGVAQSRADILVTLAKADAEVAQRREDLVKSLRRAQATRIVSPVDGTVSQLAVHTEGGVVEAARPIMVIVPDDGKIVVEARLSSRDIGFVRQGQRVAVKLEAFPFTRFGTVSGRVAAISTDSVVDDKLGAYYPLRITFDRATIDRGDAIARILPGMVVEADIRTGRRTLMSYLLSPIEEARLGAGHER